MEEALATRQSALQYTVLIDSGHDAVLLHKEAVR